MDDGKRRQALQAALDACKAKGLALDLTRGKPCAEQLALSDGLDGILGGEYLLQDGTDTRNYGGLLGLPEARALGGALLGTAPAQTLAGGASSLTLMYQYVAMMLRQVWRPDGQTPVRFICQTPGYDRHFTLCERLGIEMLGVPLLPAGPDVARIREMVQADPAIKGLWCVPKYSNPSGHTYDAQTVAALAGLGKVAGEGFRLLWDNAYAVHHLGGGPAPLADVLGKAAEAGCPDSVAVFGSTSKITFAGAGLAFFAGSEASLGAFAEHLSAQVIGFDKVNQLRHVRFLRDRSGIERQMQRHADILAPKFALVEGKLSEALGGQGLAEWSKPAGGYFVSFNTRPGLARRVVALAAAAGVTLTPAGATFPYGKDPEDRNIRLAPTCPSLGELEAALEVFVLCVQLASLEPSGEGA